jgi:hypothetical protein
MGFKAASIFVNEREPGYFGTLPVHDPTKARTLCDALGLSFTHATPSSFEQGLWPEENTFALGAYDGGMILADQNSLLTCSADTHNPLLQRTFAVFPSASVLCITLHSVINHWGYALYKQKRLVRRFVGDADKGIEFDEGTIEPEEQALFHCSTVTGPARRTFELEMRGKIEKFEENQIGELLVFLMASRLFGQRLDTTKPVDLFQLQLEVFSKGTTSAKPEFTQQLFRPAIKSIAAPVPPTKSWWKIW